MSTTTSTTVLIAYLAAVGGCQGPNRPSVARPEQDLPVVRVTYGDRVQDVNLRADYGYIVDWPGDRRPVFYVFDKARRTRTRAETWETFVAELRRVPNGNEIDEVSKCTVPFAWGMPDEKREELARILSQKGLRTISADDRRHTDFCYCESIRFAVLAGPAR